jgi:hypothetical protein
MMKQRRSEMQIIIETNADLRKALRRFAPDLEKALKKEISSVLRPVVKQARGFVPSASPLSGWAPRSFTEAKFPYFSAREIRSAIGYRTTVSKPDSRGFTSQASIFNASGAGAIYEGAGRIGPQPWVGPNAGSRSNKVSKSINPNAGQQFIDALPPLTGSAKGRGRLIFKAWALNQGKAEGAVLKAISTATQELVRRSNVSSLRRRD